MKDRAEIIKWHRDLLVAEKRLAGMGEAEAEASVPRIRLYVGDISFDAIPDPQERVYFMNLPTSFALRSRDIDRLREVAGRLMRQSPEFKTVVGEMGARLSDSAFR